MRTCIKCHQEKPESDFPYEGRNYCRICRNKMNGESYQRNRATRLAYVKNYYIENRDKKLEYAKRWAAENAERHNGYRKNEAKKLRSDVFKAYGGKCACCGESELMFLTIDHVNGGGNKHRKEVFGSHLMAGTHTYRWLRQNGYPGGFQVLCFNCNMGKHRNKGVCPHLST